MTRNTKILLSIAGVVVLIILIVGGVAGLLYVRVRIRRQAQIEKGAEFGKTTDQNGCMTEALNRARKKPRDSNELIDYWYAQWFARGCLGASKAPKDFCTNVPVNEGFTGVDEWAKARCRDLGEAYNAPCILIFKEKVAACRR